MSLRIHRALRTRAVPSSLLLAACAWYAVAPALAASPVITRLDGTQITADALSARVQALMSRANVHGLAISVFNGGENVYSRAFGLKHADTKEPLRSDTVFYGASLSKAVFAVLVMQLVEQGVIDLDTPLQKYFDEPLATHRARHPRAWHEDFTDLSGDPLHRTITARMCLSHTTGFRTGAGSSRTGSCG